MMCLGVHFLHHLFDLAIYPDKKGHTVDPHVLSTHDFFFGGPERHASPRWHDLHRTIDQNSAFLSTEIFLPDQD